MGRLCSRESDPWRTGEAGKQADGRWRREWQATGKNKGGGSLTPSNGCLHQKSPPPLNFTIHILLRLDSRFHLSEDALYELNEEHFKDKMNQPLTLLYLSSPCLPLSETVNRINWLSVLEVGLYTHTYTHTSKWLISTSLWAGSWGGQVIKTPQVQYLNSSSTWFTLLETKKSISAYFHPPLSSVSSFAKPRPTFGGPLTFYLMPKARSKCSQTFRQILHLQPEMSHNSSFPQDIPERLWWSLDFSSFFSHSEVHICGTDWKKTAFFCPHSMNYLHQPLIFSFQSFISLNLHSVFTANYKMFACQCTKLHALNISPH